MDNKDFLNNTLENFRECANEKKLVLFGCGKESENALANFTDGIDIAYFIDNDYMKWGSEFHGHEVNPPFELQKEDLDNTVVLIVRQNIFKAKMQLEALGVKHYFSSLVFLDYYMDKGEVLVRL